VPENSRRLHEDLEPQKIGKVLEKLGFDKFKKPVGKGSGTKRVYVVKWSDFAKIAKAYDYEPQSQREEKKDEQLSKT